jgi:hypothetical protein
LSPILGIVGQIFGRNLAIVGSERVSQAVPLDDDRT